MPVFWHFLFKPAPRVKQSLVSLRPELALWQLRFQEGVCGRVGEGVYVHERAMSTQSIYACVSHVCDCARENMHIHVSVHVSHI